MELTGKKILASEGMYAYMPNKPQLHNVIANAVLKAGQVVELDGTSSNTDCPVVKACAVTGEPFGVVVYDARRNEHAKGEKIAIAQSGDVIFMVAGSAVNVGAKLQFNAGTRKVDDTSVSTNVFIGKALTKALADGDLIQVELNFDLGKAQ